MSFKYIVVEGSRDAQILRHWMPANWRDRFRIITGNGKSAAISDARTLLAVGKRPVALVLDAESDAAPALKRQRDQVNQLLANASAGIDFEVIQVVPNLEAQLRPGVAVNEIPVVRKLKEFIERSSGQTSPR
jgi:hypothetical protein